MNENLFSQVQLMLQLENKSANTFGRYKSALMELEAFYPNRDLSTLSNDELRAYCLHLSNVVKAPTTYNGKVAALRYTYRIALNRRVDSYYLSLKRNPKRAPRLIPSRKEVKQIIDNCHETELACFFLLAGNSGLRRNEIATLKVNDIIKGRNLIRVTGKGGRERITVIDESVLKVLRYYYVKKRQVNNEYLFSRNTRLGHISADSITSKVNHYYAKLGMNYSLHDFRRVFATVLFLANVNIITIMEYLGHSSLNTTLKYINVDRYLDKKEVAPINLLLDDTQDLTKGVDSSCKKFKK